MVITKKTEYAIAILVGLALRRGETYISSKRLAAEEGVPANFVPQIVGILSSRQWVQALRGPAGGIRLVKDPATISLRDVIELVEGPVALSQCLVRKGVCERQLYCPLRAVWARAQNEMLRVLEEVTISSLVEARSAGEPKGG